VVLSVVLSGCQSEVVSEFSVSRDGALSETVRVVLHDEAAKSTLENIEVAKQAVAHQAGVAVSAVEVTGDADRLELIVGVPSGVSAPASGVADVTTKVVGEEVWFHATLDDAAALRAALLEAVSTEQDADALSEAMRRSVVVCVQVHMSGEITVASEGVKVSGSNAELCRVLEDWTSGEMELHAQRHSGGTSNTRWYIAGAGAVLLGVLLDRWRRVRSGA
jgi:hypothetical protein